MRTIAFLLLVACAARAQESLVERFETELRALVKSVDAAADEAIVSGAILVGTPPRVVAAYSAVGDADRLQVCLADGRQVEAVRWGGDADLGVVVFKLPDDVAKGMKGVDVEGDWARIGVGSVAVATDGRGRGGPKLGLVAAADPRLGMIDAPGDGAAVFGSRGTLIGLRGGADLSSCASCHQTAGATRFDVQLDARVREAAVAAFVGKAKGSAEHLDKKFHLWFLANAQESERPFTAMHRALWAQRAHEFRAARQDTGHLVAGPVIRRVLDDLEKFGAIQHSYLGVVVGDVEGERAVQIVTVVEGSPAAAAGLVPGARIDAVDGLACPSATFFSRALVLHRPGDEVTLLIGGREIKVRLGERSAARVDLPKAETFGLSCADLGADLRRFLGLAADVRGVVVLGVTRGSTAEEAGIQRGDVITGGGGGAIADLEELNAALAGAKGTIEFSGVRVDEASGQSAWNASLTVPEPQGR